MKVREHFDNPKLQILNYEDTEEKKHEFQQAIEQLLRECRNSQAINAISLDRSGDTLAISAINESSNGKGIQSDQSDTSLFGAGALDGTPAYFLTQSVPITPNEYKSNWAGNVTISHVRANVFKTKK